MWSSGESAFVQINCGYDFTFFKLVRLLASKVIDFTLMDHIILNTAGLFLRNFKLSSTCSFTADLSGENIALQMLLIPELTTCKFEL